MPVLVAPTAFHELACADGELATARAASRAGTVMILSSLSNTRVEDVCAAARGPVWFQLYVYRDRAATAALVARAEAAGAGALVLTVDAPLLGRRERDVRNRFHLPPGLRVENMSAAGVTATSSCGRPSSGLAAYVAAKLDPALQWKDVAWLRSITRLPVLVKGIVRPDDARRAIDHGASGVVVSNHGGRQLDGSPATAAVLGPIADAVKGRVEILVDGGMPARGRRPARARAGRASRARRAADPVGPRRRRRGRRVRRARDDARETRPCDGAGRMRTVSDVTRDLLSGARL